MKTLKQLLDGKHKTLAVVSPGDTVLHALEIMAEHDIGALLVMNGEQHLAGIFSERDYARKVILQGKSSCTTLVGEIMTDKVYYVTTERSVAECMALMTEKHVRHLPVLDADQNVLGVVSIGDMIKETISAQSFIISQMESYISG